MKRKQTVHIIMGTDPDGFRWVESVHYDMEKALHLAGLFTNSFKEDSAYHVVTQEIEDDA